MLITEIQKNTPPKFPYFTKKAQEKKKKRWEVFVKQRKTNLATASSCHKTPHVQRSQKDSGFRALTGFNLVINRCATVN